MLKICTVGNQNIVGILRHGWFDTASLCFIDMELCDLNLDDYINCRSTFVTQAPTLLNEPVFVAQDCAAHVQMLNTWTIINHIAQGIESIHENNYTHRDLKPANGIPEL